MLEICGVTYGTLLKSRSSHEEEPSDWSVFSDEKYKKMLYKRGVLVA